MSAESLPAESPAPPTRRPRSGPHRDEAARLAVLHAADDLLAEQGFGALTIEAIARRAGVAKQTIYRWWPSKVEILIDTLIEDTDKRLPLPEEATAQSIRAYLRDFAEFLTADPAGKVMLALLAQAQHDAATAESFEKRYLGPRQEEKIDLLTRAVAVGEISPRQGPEAALDALFGPIIYRALTGAEVTPEFVESLADMVLGQSRGQDGEA